MSNVPWSITSGPDGNLWYTDWQGGRIGRIGVRGRVTEYAIPTSPSYPREITPGPDGNLWFTEWSRWKIGRITPSGSITEFALVQRNEEPMGIAAGQDGNLWFTKPFYDKIGRMTVDGAVMVGSSVPWSKGWKSRSRGDHSDGRCRRSCPVQDHAPKSWSCTPHTLGAGDRGSSGPGEVISMMSGWGSGSWVSWLVMSLIMLAFWGGIVALIVWAIRGAGRPGEPRSDAESILEQRFARGEIDAEEFESRRKALRSVSGKWVA